MADMSTRLAITSCTDQLLWYAKFVGYLVPLLRDLPGERCWLSREPSGLTNIVHYKDAVLVPSGFTAAGRETVLQQQDLILINGQWLSPALELLGTPVTGHLAIRRETT
jgi:hypothetical protein